MEAPGQLESADRKPATSSAPSRKYSGSDEEETFEMNMNFLDLRSQDDFRVSFLRKLSYQKVWVPQAQRPPQHQTVVIFDWDDTLLPTSYLHVHGESQKQQ